MLGQEKECEDASTTNPDITEFHVFISIELARQS